MNHLTDYLETIQPELSNTARLFDMPEDLSGFRMEAAEADGRFRISFSAGDFSAERETAAPTEADPRLEELHRKHQELPHGGFVIRNGHNGPEGKYRQTMEFRLDLDSNPYFTGSVLAACGRAVVRLSRKGETGCRTILDIPPALLSPLDPETLRREFV